MDRLELPRLYVEDGYKPIPRIRLNDEEYARAIQSFPIISTDVVIIDYSRQTMFLAKRKAKPMTGWFMMGGRVLTDESPRESIQRCFERETTLYAQTVRFDYLCMNRYKWANRQQVPQNIGCNYHAYTFKINLNVGERKIVDNNLDADEYEKSVGLREFTRRDLVTEKVHPVILDTYDLIWRS